MHRLHKQMTILAMAFNSDGTEEAAKVTLGLNNLFLSKWAEYGKQLYSLKCLRGELVPITLE